MPSFSKLSNQRKDTLDPRLVKVLDECIKYFDFTILVGHRNKADQDAAFEGGFSKVRYPNSKHNSFPSKAVDIAPYPINWNDTLGFVYLAGFMVGIAKTMGINLRWGGDWDSDRDQKDQTFFDRGHFEIID